MPISENQKKHGIETMLRLFEGRPELLSSFSPNQAVDALIAGAEKIGNYVSHVTIEPQSKD